jgi:ATP-dependent DNA helicase RecQ
VNHVIRYIPADHATVLYLQHNRLRPGNVQLSPKRYQMLRSTYAERVQAIIEYVEDDNVCRSQYLLKYFGQEKSDPCGKCDYCRAAKARPEDLRGQLKAWIEGKKGRYTLTEVRTAFGTVEESYLETLRDLIDKKEVPPYKE